MHSHEIYGIKENEYSIEKGQCNHVAYSGDYNSSGALDVALHHFFDTGDIEHGEEGC